MPDDLFGEPTPRLPGTRRPRTAQARENAQQSVLRHERLLAVVSHPGTYALADYLPEPALDAPGRPGEFPLYVYLLFNALTALFASARATAAHLQDPSVWAVVRQGVASVLGPEAAEALPDHGPNRNQWLHNRKKLTALLPQLLDAFREHALTQATSQGLLDATAPRSWSAPQRAQLVVGDGTVVKSPVNAKKATSVDKRTGEVRHHRIDTGSGEHREGGEERGVKVYGPKFVLVSARNGYYHERVILDLRYQPPKFPGGEAALALESILALVEAAPGLLGVVWDGVVRGVHRDELAKAGLLVVNKQHDGLPNWRLPTLREDGCYHDLWASGGRVAERTLTEDGTEEFRPVPVTRLERRANADAHRWYHVLEIPCARHGSHTHRVRLDQTEEDKKQRFNRSEYLRQIPPGTAAFEDVYGNRPDIESLNALLDATWRFKRIIAYGAARQTLAVLGFASAHNAIARHAYTQRQARESATSA